MATSSIKPFGIPRDAGGAQPFRPTQPAAPRVDPESMTDSELGARIGREVYRYLTANLTGILTAILADPDNGPQLKRALGVFIREIARDEIDAETATIVAAVEARVKARIEPELPPLVERVVADTLSAGAPKRKLSWFERLQVALPTFFFAAVVVLLLIASQSWHGVARLIVIAIIPASFVAYFVATMGASWLRKQPAKPDRATRKANREAEEILKLEAELAAKKNKKNPTTATGA